MRPVLTTEHFVLTYDAENRILRLTRTKVPFTSGMGSEPEIASVEAALGSFDADRTALLTDLREAPSRNDESFEGSFARNRQRLFGRFAHAAVLVRTAVGKLQITRLGVGQEGGSAVFQSEEAAVTHLRDALQKQ